MTPLTLSDTDPAELSVDAIVVGLHSTDGSEGSSTPLLAPGAESVAVAFEGRLAETLALLDDPALAPLFGPGARAEVAVAGEIVIGGVRRAVSGQIDRLAVTDEAVIFADFKTSARPPADLAGAPVAHVGQLAVYGALLADIFPGRRLEALLVYTAGPRVLAVPDEALAAALDQLPVL